MIKSFNFWMVIIPLFMVLAVIWGWCLITEKVDQAPKLRFSDSITKKSIMVLAAIAGITSGALVMMESYRGILELFRRDGELSVIGLVATVLVVGTSVAFVVSCIPKKIAQLHWGAIVNGNRLCTWWYYTKTRMMYAVAISFLRCGDWISYRLAVSKAKKEYTKSARQQYNKYCHKRNSRSTSYANKMVDCLTRERARRLNPKTGPALQHRPKKRPKFEYLLARISRRAEPTGQNKRIVQAEIIDSGLNFVNLGSEKGARAQ